MPIQQRYTPVPGMERPGSNYGTTTGGGGGYGNIGVAPGEQSSSGFTNTSRPNPHNRSPSSYSDPFNNQNRVSTASIADPSIDYISTTSPPITGASRRSSSGYGNRNRDLPSPPTDTYQDQNRERVRGPRSAPLAAGAAAGIGAGAMMNHHSDATNGGNGYSNPYGNNEQSYPQSSNDLGYNNDTPLTQSHDEQIGLASGAGAGAGSSGVGGQGRSTGTAYENAPSEKYNGFSAAKGSKKKWWIIGGIIALLAIIGIVVGVVVSQVTKNKSNNKGNSSSGSGSGNGSGGVLSNPNDPSVFTKDDRLHQSFWGFAYTPQGAQPPWCSTSQANVTRDIQLMSQLTTRLRLYGANCNITALVLQAIQDTKVNMTVWPAIYVDSNETAYTSQVSAIQSALKTYGTKHIEGITVGNEYILNTAGTTSLTSSKYLSAVSTITTKISSFNTTIKGMNLDKHLPIGTSDAGSVMSVRLGEGIDYFMANVHPWFGGLPISQAADWTWEFFQENDVSIAQQATNQPATYIAETGWPTASMNASEANDGAGSPQGDASVANLQTFLDTYVCQANSNGTQYFYFEAFDEPWKAQYGGVEPYWGLFDSDRTLKNVTIPKC